LLKTKLFISQKILDTHLLWLIRFSPESFDGLKLRWNYSPLKEKAAHVAGWPFRFCPERAAHRSRDRHGFAETVIRYISYKYVGENKSGGENREDFMFCDKCGATVLPDQRFCSRCGKEFSGTLAVAYPRPNRVQGHIRLLGILWLALSALNALGGVVLFILANTLFAHLHEMGAPPQTPTTFLRSLFTVLGIFVLGKAACGFLAGWGLLQREAWARMLTVVLAFLALFNIPFGTALGIYSLWVLLPAESEVEYEAHVRAAEAG
jgi:hypothetical protein